MNNNGGSPIRFGGYGEDTKDNNSTSTSNTNNAQNTLMNNSVNTDSNSSNNNTNVTSNVQSTVSPINFMGQAINNNTLNNQVNQVQPNNIQQMVSTPISNGQNQGQNMMAGQNSNSINTNNNSNNQNISVNQQLNAMNNLNTIEKQSTNTTQVDTTTNTVSDEKKSILSDKKNVIMIIITALVLIGLGVFLFLYLGGGNKKQPDSPDVNYNIEDLSSWKRYILNQDITDVKLTVSNNERPLTTDELTDIFFKLANNGLIRDYTNSDGVDFNSDYALTVTYRKNDMTYYFYILNDRLWFADENSNYSLVPSDNDLLNEIEKSLQFKYDNNSNGTSKTYTINEFDSSIYDSYYN